jgi:hypothetical protein
LALVVRFAVVLAAFFLDGLLILMPPYLSDVCRKEPGVDLDRINNWFTVSAVRWLLGRAICCLRLGGSALDRYVILRRQPALAMPCSGQRLGFRLDVLPDDLGGVPVWWAASWKRIPDLFQFLPRLIDGLLVFPGRVSIALIPRALPVCLTLLEVIQLLQEPDVFGAITNVNTKIGQSLLTVGGDVVISTLYSLVESREPVERLVFAGIVRASWDLSLCQALADLVRI